MEEKSYPPYLDRPKHIVQTMEEKELNLCELLKGCDGEIFYTPLFGDMSLDKIATDSTKPIHMQVCEDAIWFFRGGNFTEEGECMLYPSRSLYEKYPLDAKAAWTEWKDERKPKRWYPQHGEEVWHLDLSLNPKKTHSHIPYSQWEGELNCFQTEELCKQAAEGICEYLKSFHEKNLQQSCTIQNKDLSLWRNQAL